MFVTANVIDLGAKGIGEGRWEQEDREAREALLYETRRPFVSRVRGTE